MLFILKQKQIRELVHVPEELKTKAITLIPDLTEEDQDALVEKFEEGDKKLAAIYKEEDALFEEIDAFLKPLQKKEMKEFEHVQRAQEDKTAESFFDSV